MDPSVQRRRVADARVGRLATVSAGGRPHLVPVCFALVGDVIYSAVDAKPKRTTALRRLDHIRATGVACLLVDHYADDWSGLWWVRVDGSARVVADAPERQRALDALAGKYEQYRREPPTGAVLALDPERWSGWEAAGGHSSAITGITR